MNRFSEYAKVDLAINDTTGSTAEVVSQYFDMSGYESVDFFVTVNAPLTTANSTAINQLNARILQSSSASSPATVIPITSATVTVGSTVTGCVVGKVAALRLLFTTLDTGATFSINGVQFGANSTGSATSTSGYFESTGATANATVASERFKTLFNTTYSSTLCDSFVATTDAAGAIVHIWPKDPGTTYLTCTGTTLVNAGFRAVAHLGCRAVHLNSTNQYVAVAINSCTTKLPFSAICVRSGGRLSPVAQKSITSKVIGSSNV